MRYSLEIYEPGSHNTTVGNYEGDSPFMRIDVGDIIEPQGLNGVGTIAKPFLLRAISIEHIIWTQAGQTNHRVCIFTEEIPVDTDLIP